MSRQLAPPLPARRPETPPSSQPLGPGSELQGSTPQPRPHGTGLALLSSPLPPCRPPASTARRPACGQPGRTRELLAAQGAATGTGHPGEGPRDGGSPGLPSAATRTLSGGLQARPPCACPLGWPWWSLRAAGRSVMLATGMVLRSPPPAAPPQACLPAQPQASPAQLCAHVLQLPGRQAGPGRPQEPDGAPVPAWEGALRHRGAPACAQDKSPLLQTRPHAPASPGQPGSPGRACQPPGKLLPRPLRSPRPPCWGCGTPVSAWDSLPGGQSPCQLPAPLAPPPRPRWAWGNGVNGADSALGVGRGRTWVGLRGAGLVWTGVRGRVPGPARLSQPREGGWV